MRFAEALCAQVATAIGRAELFSRLESLAYEDQLTRLPNRRALDERLEEAVARALATGRELALLFCDLDGAQGGQRPPRARRRATARSSPPAEALAEAAAGFPGSFTSRLGGDEFCVLMEGHGADGRPRAGARRVRAGWRRARRPVRVLVRRRLPRRGAPPRRPTSSVRPTRRSTRPSASAAASVFVAEPGMPDAAIPRPSRDRAAASATPTRTSARRSSATCSSCSTASSAARASLARVEAVAGAFAEAFDAAKWTISRRRRGSGRGARPCSAPSGASAHAAGVRFSVEDEAYALADYPLTAAILERGGGFAIDAGDEDARPARARAARSAGASRR